MLMIEINTMRGLIFLYVTELYKIISYFHYHMVNILENILSFVGSFKTETVETF